MATLAAVASLTAGASPISAHDTAERGPWPLVSLAALGTVSWRCDPARAPGPAAGLAGLALGFTASAADQTASLRFRARGRTVLTRTIQPGRSVELPYLHAESQRIEIAERGEDGTLRAVVDVTFAPHTTSGYCWPYMPPTTELTLLGRR